LLVQSQQVLRAISIEEKHGKCPALALALSQWKKGHETLDKCDFCLSPIDHPPISA